MATVLPASPLGTSMAANSYLTPTILEQKQVRSQLIAERREVLLDSRTSNLRANCGQANDFWAAMSTWFGVSVRDPTSDERLIKLCLSLPDEQFQSAEEQRLLAGKYLRNAGLNHIVDCRFKGLQAADIRQRLMLDTPAVQEILTELRDCSSIRAWLDVQKLQDGWASYQEASDSSLSGYFWSASWLRAVSAGYLMHSGKVLEAVL